jgi:hypothetical protein
MKSNNDEIPRLNSHSPKIANQSPKTSAAAPEDMRKFTPKGRIAKFQNLAKTANGDRPLDARKAHTLPNSLRATMMKRSCPQVKCKYKKSYTGSKNKTEDPFLLEDEKKWRKNKS